jgi:hypothetical protein
LRLICDKNNEAGLVHGGIMGRITNWLAEPFEQSVRQYRDMWYWQSTTDDDERHLHSYVARAHPIWYARYRLAQWLVRVYPKCRNLLGGLAALVYLVGALIYIAAEVVYNRIARTLWRGDSGG